MRTRLQRALFETMCTHTCETLHKYVSLGEFNAGTSKALTFTRKLENEKAV